MIEFHPNDPYPVLSRQEPTVVEMQKHAAQVDAWLGFHIIEIERALQANGCRLSAPGAKKERQELWFGLDPQSLLTPYVEIRAILERLSPRPGQKIVDLGAAYGRMGFVIWRHYPGVEFLGYEFVGERVQEARRCYRRNGHRVNAIEHADLSAPDFMPQEADFYFLYDYGTLKAIEKTLHDLKRLAKRKKITLIARGRHCRYLIERSHSWLKKVDPNAVEAPYSIYTPELFSERGIAQVP